MQVFWWARRTRVMHSCQYCNIAARRNIGVLILLCICLHTVTHTKYVSSGVHECMRDFNKRCKGCRLAHSPQARRPPSWSILSTKCGGPAGLRQTLIWCGKLPSERVSECQWSNHCPGCTSAGLCRSKNKPPNAVQSIVSVASYLLVLLWGLPVQISATVWQGLRAVIAEIPC
jgi:hypothetical protein